jgi:3-hydroxyisobutyrate dehydrogenase-like beta-hydroxyacid dehydrogenase
MRIGFVGLGRMGQAMVPRLLHAGYTVTVWNRTAARAQPLLERGATLASSLAELASTSDIVLDIVYDDAAVEAIYHPETGLLSGNVAGTLFIEMSTIRPDTIQRLAPQVEARGASLLDAPVSGTTGPAREGQLMALVGGTAADLERARPVLDVLCRRVAHLGASGSGTLMKLVLNMPMAVYWQALAEALTMGTRSGLDARQMIELIEDSPAMMGALKIKKAAILEGIDEATFTISGVRKDLIAMTTTGQSLGVPMPAASASLLSFAAASAADWAERDLADLIAYYADMVNCSAGNREEK